MPHIYIGYCWRCLSRFPKAVEWKEGPLMLCLGCTISAAKNKGKESLDRDNWKGQKEKVTW